MATYSAPIADIRFLLYEVIGLDRITALPGCDSATPDIVDAVLEEAGKFAAGVIAPTNAVGDKEGLKFENGIVRVPACFVDAYRQYVESGWNAVPFDPEFGGQGLPWLVAFPVLEMWQAANMAFALCPMLNTGAVELLEAHGSPQQKETYLSKLIAGEWTGTMDLTEPQAGSDLSAVRAKAVRDGDVYRLFGQKIFITYGEHEMAENIIHLALARLPDAPAGVKGISLFMVPKFLVNSDGSLGKRNDIHCTGIEHKLGIHASPTAVISYGDNDGAVGYLIGQENRGLEYMFIMMNNARLNVGLQGVAISDRAYQAALEYAKIRVQSRDMRNPKAGPVAIINHPDVRRMLMSMKAHAEATRALAYEAAAFLDLAKRSEDKTTAKASQYRVDLLTPVVKAWSTDVGVEVASTGVQVFGGMGFIEESGAPQFYRDARIAPIYEGTNGIQANDLVFRKLGRDQGEAARVLFKEMRDLCAELAQRQGDEIAIIATALTSGVETLEQATTRVLELLKTDPVAAAGGSALYLRMFGTVAGGYMMARSAAAAQDGLKRDPDKASFYQTKLVTARFYAEQILPLAAALLSPVSQGCGAIMALTEDQF
ncbi:3-methylmercaptopropionyl-CoA dehydrogenase [Azospirillaceae bacterium]